MRADVARFFESKGHTALPVFQRNPLRTGAVAALLRAFIREGHVIHIVRKDVPAALLSGVAVAFARTISTVSHAFKILRQAQRRTDARHLLPEFVTKVAVKASGKLHRHHAVLDHAIDEIFALLGHDVVLLF